MDDKDKNTPHPNLLDITSYRYENMGCRPAPRSEIWAQNNNLIQEIKQKKSDEHTSDLLIDHRNNWLRDMGNRAVQKQLKNVSKSTKLDNSTNGELLIKLRRMKLQQLLVEDDLNFNDELRAKGKAINEDFY